MLGPADVSEGQSRRRCCASCALAWRFAYRDRNRGSAVARTLARSWGFPDQESSSGSVKGLLRVLGGRDIVLGLATLAARDNPAGLRTMVAASAAVDTGDTAVSLGLATASPGARRPAIAWALVGIPFGALGWRIRERL